MEKAVFGIIGLGGIAQSQHLPNLTRGPTALSQNPANDWVALDLSRRQRLGFPYCLGDTHG